MNNTVSLPASIPLGAVISITCRGRTIFFNKRLAPYDISAGQVGVLMLLFQEQNIIQETLARHYHLNRGTIARAVRKLEDTGYLYRVADPENRRAFRLFLTRKGMAIAPVICQIEQEWEEMICKDLPNQDRGRLTTLMHHVAETSIAHIRSMETTADATE